MVLKKMLSLCNKTKTISILYFGKQKLLSNGEVAADITRIAPDWEIEDIAIAMEIPEDKIEAYEQTERRYGALTKNQIVEVTDYEELERLSYSLNMGGKPCQPFRMRDGRLIIVEMELLSVFKDTGIKTFRFGEIELKPCILVCVDSMCMGIVTPRMVDLTALKAFADTLSVAADKSLAKGFLDAGGQLEITDI